MPPLSVDTKRPVCEDSLSIDVLRWSRDGTAAALSRILLHMV